MPMTFPPAPAAFPASRPRRMRRSGALRDMVRETTLAPADFIWPVFLMAGNDAEEAIPSMPGVTRKTVDRVVAAAKEAHSLGIPAICLFP